MTTVKCVVYSKNGRLIFENIYNIQRNLSPVVISLFFSPPPTSPAPPHKRLILNDTEALLYYV